MFLVHRSASGHANPPVTTFNGHVVEGSGAGPQVRFFVDFLLNGEI